MAFTVPAMLTASLPAPYVGEHLLGISGLTFGGLGVWGILAMLAAWWIKGMADRRRADNEGTTAGSNATATLIKHLTAEVERLGNMVTIQSNRITELEHKLAHTEGEVIRLQAASAGFGDARQHAALIVAAEKLDAQPTAKID